jgi:hypothetical protein
VTALTPIPFEPAQLRPRHDSWTAERQILRRLTRPRVEPLHSLRFARNGTGPLARVSLRTFVKIGAQDVRGTSEHQSGELAGPPLA